MEPVGQHVLYVVKCVAVQYVRQYVRQYNVDCRAVCDGM